MTWSVDVAVQRGTLALEVTLSPEAGTVVVVGPNGAGKSTLLQTIAGAHRPTRGRIVIDGTTVFDADGGADQPPEARRVGYVPQGHRLFPHLDVLRNVAFGLRGPGALDRAREVLASLGAEALAHRRAGELSGGEAQRVALARALAPDPRLLLLDEPLAALDVAARRRVRHWLAETIEARAIPTLLVTHDVRDVRALAGIVVVLERGRVTQHGTAGALAADPTSEFVSELFADS